MRLMKWTRWMRSRVLTLTIAIIISPVMAAPSVFALGETSHLRPVPTALSGMEAGIAKRMAMETLRAMSAEELRQMLQPGASVEEFMSSFRAGHIFRPEVFEATNAVGLVDWRLIGSHWEDQVSLADPGVLVEFQNYLAQTAVKRGLARSREEVLSQMPLNQKAKVLRQAAQQAGVEPIWHVPEAARREEAAQKLTEVSENLNEAIDIMHRKLDELAETLTPDELDSFHKKLDLIRLDPAWFTGGIVYGTDPESILSQIREQQIGKPQAPAPAAPREKPVPPGSVLGVYRILLEDGSQLLTRAGIARRANREIGTIEPDLAALKQWGLVEVTGKGADAVYRLPEAARLADAELEPILRTLPVKLSRAQRDALAPQIAAILEQAGATAMAGSARGGVPRLVYFSGQGRSEGVELIPDPKERRNLLGGKGISIHEMMSAGLPVPPAFTITTQVGMAYLKSGQYPPGLKEAVATNLQRIEREMGREFGNSQKPLLVSVRSGAPESMPGMMDTVLNLGLNDETVEGLARETGDRRFAFDTYRRFIESYGHIVLGIAKERVSEIREPIKQRLGITQDSELNATTLEQELIPQYKTLVQEQTGQPFPRDVNDQLGRAIEAVFKSWNSKKAKDYREIQRSKGVEIPEDWGTAVNVQAMVFGNMGEDSGTGVYFTRDHSTGERVPFGDFSVNAQGEDVVSGAYRTQPIHTLQQTMPDNYDVLIRAGQFLEATHKDMMDIEVTIEHGRLYLLQNRSGKRTPLAAVKIAVDMTKEGLISREEAIQRVTPEQVIEALVSKVDPEATRTATLLTRGEASTLGAASGKIAFSEERVLALKAKGERVILVRPETDPSLVKAMVTADGTLTSRGGRASHAIIVGAAENKVVVAGAEQVQVDEHAGVMRIGDRVFREATIRTDAVDNDIIDGDEITIDADPDSRAVYLGALPVIPGQMVPELRELLAWADDIATMKVWANADTPGQARQVREYGAKGIGLVRTEHMFFAPERMPIMQRMIMAGDDLSARRAALNELEQFQRQDFEAIFEAMDGLPTTIRLLDPPLHEFLPGYVDLALEVQRLELLSPESTGATPQIIAEKKATLQAVEKLKEVNPMLGFRGARMGIVHPDITQMQVRAIARAAAKVTKERGVKTIPKIMIPLIGRVTEYQNQAQTTREAVEGVLTAEGLSKKDVPYWVGTMIEVPAATYNAGAIAQGPDGAEFFSFGTNDLTQLVFGYSRDDVAKFFGRYRERGIITTDPFAVLQPEVAWFVGVGVKGGRAVKPPLEIGICGEHARDPSSVVMFHILGLDYVSPSSVGVLSARLAAAQAQLKYPRTTPSAPVAAPAPAAPMEPGQSATGKSWDSQSALPALVDLHQHLINTASGEPFALRLESHGTTLKVPSEGYTARLSAPLLVLWRNLFSKPQGITEDSKAKIWRALEGQGDSEKIRFLQRVHQSLEWLHVRTGANTRLQRAIGSLLERNENEEIWFGLIEKGVLGNQMARYVEGSGKPIIAIDEEFYRATIGGETVSPGGQRVFTERLLHELGHDNRFGTYEEELAEETRVLREIDWFLYQALGADTDLEAFLAGLPSEVKPAVTGKAKYTYFAQLSEGARQVSGVGKQEQFIRDGVAVYAHEVVSGDLRRFGKAFAMPAAPAGAPTPAVVIRPGLQELYPDVYTPEALGLLGEMAPLSQEMEAVGRERIAKRNERARIGREVQQRRRDGYYGTGESFRQEEYLADKRRAQLHFLPETNEDGSDARIEGTPIRVRDARRGNFIGSPIPPKLQTQYVQLTGPAVKPKNPNLLDPAWEVSGPMDMAQVLRLGHEMLDRVGRGERLDQITLRSFPEWVALGLIGDLRNVAHQLLSGADDIMEDLEDAAGQLSLMALDNQRSLKLAVARDPLFMRVAKQVAGEYKQAGELRIDGELKPQGPLTDAEWEAWNHQLDFTLQLVRARALHLADRHSKYADGRFISASIVDTGLFWANNYRAYLERGLPMVTYIAKVQRAKEAARWDRMFQEMELFLMKHDPRVFIGMFKVEVLVEQHQAVFEAAEIRAAFSQGGSKVEIVELMKQKGEFSTEAEYQQRLQEAREEDARFLGRTGVDPKNTESRFLVLDTGRWDIINNTADENAWDAEWIPPNIEAMTMTYPFMAAQERRVFQVVNVPDLLGRRALWVGGMEPQIPVGPPEAIELGMQRAVAGAERERDAGAEGKWAAHPKMVHRIRQVWAEKGHGYIEAIQAKATPPTYTQADEDALRALDPDPQKSPITVRGARNLISVGIQMGNAHLRGLQAAALKPADFFESRAVDDVEATWRNRIKDAEYALAIAEAQVAHIVERRSEFADESAYQQALEKARAQATQARLNLFLMEDMATGEIRLTILWNWLHKGAKFTADDEETGVRAGDAFTRELFLRLYQQEYQKLLDAAPKNVHEESKTATLPIAGYITQRYVLEDVKLPWYIDLLNIALDQPVEEARRQIDRYIEAWKRDGTRLTENPTFGVDIRTLLGLRPAVPTVLGQEEALQAIAQVPEQQHGMIAVIADRILQQHVADPAERVQKAVLLRGILSQHFMRGITREQAASQMAPLLGITLEAAQAELERAPVSPIPPSPATPPGTGPTTGMMVFGELGPESLGGEGPTPMLARQRRERNLRFETQRGRPVQAPPSAAAGPIAFISEGGGLPLGGVLTPADLTWEVVKLQDPKASHGIDFGPRGFLVLVDPQPHKPGTEVGLEASVPAERERGPWIFTLTPSRDAADKPELGLRELATNPEVPFDIRRGYAQLAGRFGLVDLAGPFAGASDTEAAQFVSGMLTLAGEVQQSGGRVMVVDDRGLKVRLVPGPGSELAGRLEQLVREGEALSLLTGRLPQLKPAQTHRPSYIFAVPPRVFEAWRAAQGEVAPTDVVAALRQRNVEPNLLMTRPAPTELHIAVLHGDVNAKEALKLLEALIPPEMLVPPLHDEGSWQVLSPSLLIFHRGQSDIMVAEGPDAVRFGEGGLPERLVAGDLLIIRPAVVGGAGTPEEDAQLLRGTPADATTLREQILASAEANRLLVDSLLTQLAGVARAEDSAESYKTSEGIIQQIVAAGVADPYPIRTYMGAVRREAQALRMPLGGVPTLTEPRIAYVGLPDQAQRLNGNTLVTAVIDVPPIPAAQPLYSYGAVAFDAGWEAVAAGKATAAGDWLPQPIVGRPDVKQVDPRTVVVEVEQRVGEFIRTYREFARSK